MKEINRIHTPYRGNNPYIFISYSHKDSDVVFDIALLPCKVCYDILDSICYDVVLFEKVIREKGIQEFRNIRIEESRCELRLSTASGFFIFSSVIKVISVC